MQVVSKHTIVAKGEKVTPGLIVEIDDREAKSLINRGLVRAPTEEDRVVSRRIEQQEAGRTAAEADEDEDVSEMSRSELEARAEDLKIDLGKVKGSGKNGSLLKADLVKAIEKAEREAEKSPAAASTGGTAAPGTSTGGTTGTPSNPSLA